MLLVLVALLCAVPAVARAAKTGWVEGVIEFDGPRPSAAPAARHTDPACPGAPAPEAGSGIAHVLVREVGRPRAKAARTAPGLSPLVIEQRGCAYVPAVAGLVRGQALEIRSADGTLHNVHAWLGDETTFNLAQPTGSPPIVREVDASVGEVLRLACDVHPWMTAHVVIVDGPDFAVTDARGVFKLENLTPGIHVLEAWHPTLGTRTAQVTVVAGRSAAARIAYPGQPAPAARTPRSPRSTTMNAEKKAQP